MADASTVPTHYKTSFSNMVRLLQQQRTTRFRNAVLVDTQPEIEGKMAFYDQLEPTSMTEIKDRHGKTQVTETPHQRRAVTFTPAEKATMVDRADLRRVANDPRSSHGRNHVMAANRYLDDKIIGAYFATAKTGEDGSGSAAFDTTNFQVAAGTSGMTLDKIKQAHEKLESAENGNVEDDGDDFRWYAAVAALQQKDMQGIQEFISIDYAAQKLLGTGRVSGIEWMGFTWIRSERLLKTGSNRRCPFWVKSSMQAAISQDVVTFMDIMPGNRHSVQIRTEVDEGATRLDEKGVVEVLCVES